MASPKTIARLEAQIQRRVAHCLTFELSDPRVGFMTVTRVKLSNDLSTAKIFYSVLGDESAERMAGDVLESAQGFVREKVARILRTRTVPSLVWVFDDSVREAARMDNVIREARERDRAIRGEAEPPDELDAEEPRPGDPLADDSED